MSSPPGREGRMRWNACYVAVCSRSIFMTHPTVPNALIGWFNLTAKWTASCRLCIANRCTGKELCRAGVCILESPTACESAFSKGTPVALWGPAASTLFFGTEFHVKHTSLQTNWRSSKGQKTSPVCKQLPAANKALFDSKD